MEMIKDEDAKVLFESFRNTLQGDVDIVVFTGDSDRYSREAKLIGRELAHLNPKIHYVHHNIDRDIEEAREYGVSESPTVMVAKHGVMDDSFKFTGLPSGYEFTTLIEAIKVVSRNEAPLTASVVQKIARVTNDTYIEVYVTPTCPYSPRVAQAAQKFAFLNPHIKAEVIESVEFHDRARESGVGAVPHVIVNGGAQEFIGGFPDEYFASQVEEAQTRVARERSGVRKNPHTPLGAKGAGSPE